MITFTDCRIPGQSVHVCLAQLHSPFLFAPQMTTLMRSPCAAQSAEKKVAMYIMLYINV